MSDRLGGRVADRMGDGADAYENTGMKDEARIDKIAKM